MRTTTIRLSADDEQTIRGLADQLDIGQSDVIRLAVRRLAEEQQLRTHRVDLLIERVARFRDADPATIEAEWSPGRGSALARAGVDTYVDTPRPFIYLETFAEDGSLRLTALPGSGINLA